MNIANLIKCVGLVTFGSTVALPEGSLAQALNVNIDEDGVITPRRGFAEYSGPTTGTETTSELTTQLMEYKDALIRKFDDSMEYEDTSNVFQSITGTFNPIRSGYRTKWQEANSNLYFTTDQGIKKISETSQANFNANMVDDAGGLKAGYADGITVPTVGGFLAPQSKVAYRVLFGYRDNTNNLIYGSPSSRFVVTNFAEDQITYETQTITFTTTTTTDEITNGDHIILYAGTTKYVIWFSVSSGSAPKTANTIGGTYIEVVADGIVDDDSSLAAFTANEIASNISGLDVSVSSGVVTITQSVTGDITNISDGYSSANVDISSRLSGDVDTDGETVTGQDVNVQVTGIVPSGATTDYFYQIYRTAPITATTGLTLNDIDPGDEMNLVYEAGLTTAEISANQFVVTDTTPESFRNSGLPLYTNEASGEGILQANETPPIALDMELFKNYMFYGNTKQRHKMELTMVSVDNFLSGSTKLIIGNSDITRFYLFTGVAHIDNINLTKVPYEGDYINAYSANDYRQYYIYFGPSNVDPEIAGATGYRIDISDLTEGDTTLSNREIVAERIVAAFTGNVDFTVTNSTTTVTFTYKNNGTTTGLTEGTDTDAAFNITNTTTGEGEETGAYYGGKVLLSGLTSVGQAIDETARSLVKAISSDANSPVNAYYISSGEELPGNILLEARTLEDNDFYVAIDSGYALYSGATLYDPGDFVQYDNLDYICLQTTTGNAPTGAETDNAYWQYSPVGDEFTPEIPNSRDYSFEEGGTTGFTQINYTDHPFSDGDTIFVGYYKNPSNGSDPASFSGTYTVSSSTTNTFEIEQDNTGLSTFDPLFRMAIFNPTLVSDNEELPNRVYYSKRKQPEAVPTINFIDIGPQDSEILRILALRDELYVLKEDGIYVISGTSAPDPQTGTGGWTVRLVDSAEILAPDSAVVLNNQIYCLSDQGVIRISGSSVGVISRGIEDRINRIVDADYEYSPNTFGIAYENDRAYVLFTPQSSTDTSATQAYRYNIFEKTWSRWEYEATCGIVMRRDNKMYLGNGDRNYVSQERKNNDRTDHADRNFSASINASGVSGTTIELSTLVNVKPNDVIVQTQTVTIYYINWKLLKKMDLFDTGITPPSGFSSMYEAFEATAGEDLVDVMQAINDHLRTLDATNISSKTFSAANIRTNTELLVTELNTTATITSVKTYKNPQTVSYEAYITEIDTLKNQVTIHTTRPFIEGAIEVYKGFTCTIEWNPLHFGNPAALKQVSHMTIMFDQNNFNAATAKFYSDASQGAVEVPFLGKGVAYWGDLAWGNNTNYWGGEGNDMPYRTIVPRAKQKCRYISIAFEHKVARENFRVLGVSGTVRQISDRAYKQLK